MSARLAWLLALAIAAIGAALAQEGGGGSTPAPPSRPVEVFVPSEKITADSAVTFPTDI